MLVSRLASIPEAEMSRIQSDSGRWHKRVEVRRRGEVVYVDMTDLLGKDWVVEISTKGATIDSPVTQFSIHFLRQDQGRSLAPGIVGDPFNQVAGNFKPLLHADSEVRVTVANTPSEGGTPTYRFWLEGVVEDVEWPDQDVVILCNSMEWIVEDTDIRAEEVRGAPDPGTPVEEEIQLLNNRWMQEPVTLHVLGEPGLGIGEYKPSVGKLGEQNRALAGRIAWKVRYLYWDGENRYTLFEPPRDKTEPDLTIAPDMVRQVLNLKESGRDIRNSFTATAKDADGRTFTRNRVTVYPAGSPSYRERWMGLTLSEDGGAMTVEQVDALLLAAEQDISLPLAEYRVRLPFIPYLDLYDLLAFDPDDIRFDTATVWSVVGVSHTVTATERYTEVDLHGGGVVGQYNAWFDRESGGFSTDVEARSLYDFKVIRRDPDGTLVYGFKRNPDVHSVWAAAGVYDGEDESEEDWDDLLLRLARLSIDEVRLPPAAQDQFAIAHVESRDRNLQPGGVWRTKQLGSPPEVRPQSVSFPESEDGTQASAVVEMIDPRGVLTGINVYFTTAGVRTGPFPATLTAPLTWEYGPWAQHPDHPISVELEGPRNDGKPAWVYGPLATDTNKVAGVPVVTQVRDGASVELRVDPADTDAVAHFYRQDSGGTIGPETPILARDGGGDLRYGALTVTAGPDELRYLIYSKNAAGVGGLDHPYKDERVAPYFPPVDTLFSRVEIRMLPASNATETVLEVSTVPAGGTVTLVSVSGSAARTAGPAVGVPSADGSVWTFSRGAINSGSGSVEFSGAVAGYEPDTDFETIEEQGRDTVPLLLRTRVLDPTTGGATVRAYPADPYPGGDISIAYTFTGLESVTPGSPQTVLSAVVTADLDTTGYVDFAVLFGSTPGRLVLTASRAGRLAAVDAADLPAADRSNGISEVLAVHVANDGATAYAVAHFDPDTITGTAAGEYRLDGGPGITTFDINSDREGEFSFLRSTSGVRVLEVRGNDATGPGPWHRREVDRYDPPPPAIYSVTPSVEDTGVGGNDVYSVVITGASMSGKTAVVEFYRNGVLRDTEDFAIASDTSATLPWTDLGVGDGVEDQHYVRVQLYSGFTAHGPQLVSRTVPSAT